MVRNALVEVTEEMSASIQRAAYSTNVKTRLDYSCGFVDSRGRIVAQAFCQPAHLVTIGRLVPRAVAEYGVENLEPGDALVVNDPHRQASHLNDIFSFLRFSTTASSWNTSLTSAIMSMSAEALRPA